MSKFRTVQKLSKGRPTVDGAGVHLVRVLGHADVKDYDPFLMLDAFDSTNPEDYVKGFPWHPHRGIETITYLIHGDIEHGDSLSNTGSILDGECQWMTAGSGILHQEMPKPCDRMLGAQLWLNLPAKDKMTDPSYGDIKADSVPIIYEDGIKIRILAGEYLGTKGAFKGKYIPATYLDVELQQDEEWSVDTDPEQTVFVYLFSGKATFDPEDIEEPGEIIDEKQAVLFSSGDKLWVKAVGSDVRLIMLSAKPLNEPIAWGGPIVMNTSEELRQASEDLENNTFIRVKS